MASLKNHAKKKILFEMEDVVLYTPTKKQELEIRKMIEDNSKITDGEIDISIGLKIIRYILKELSNIDNEEIDGMTDDELDIALDGDRVLIKLGETIEDIISDIGEKIAKDLERQVKSLMSMTKSIEMGKSVDEFKDKYNKMAKKNKLPVFDELIKMTRDKEEIEKEIKGNE